MSLVKHTKHVFRDSPPHHLLNALLLAVSQADTTTILEWLDNGSAVCQPSHVSGA